MKGIIIILCLLLTASAFSQTIQLHGSVYDFYNHRPVESVDVFTSAGRHTITDTVGRYTILVNSSDSIWFSFLGKQTRKYVADTISDYQNFDVALYIDAKWLPSVTVHNRNYTLDSIQNRQEYSKVFNFRKPGLRVTSPSASSGSYVPGSVTAALDLDEIINMFRFRRNRQILTFQERLVREEQDKYIEHRFSKALIKKLTGETNEYQLSYFMAQYKPDYNILLLMNDIELGYYIQQAYKSYRDGYEPQFDSLYMISH